MDVVRAEHGNPGLWMQSHGSLDGQFFLLLLGIPYLIFLQSRIPYHESSVQDDIHYLFVRYH